MDTTILQMVLTSGLAGIGAFLTVWLVKWHVPKILEQQEKLVVSFESALAKIDTHCREETQQLRDLAVSMMKQVCAEAKQSRIEERQKAKEDSEAARQHREIAEQLRRDK